VFIPARAMHGLYRSALCHTIGSMNYLLKPRAEGLSRQMPTFLGRFRGRSTMPDRFKWEILVLNARSPSRMGILPLGITV
jgi:hypothetical protein